VTEPENQSTAVTGPEMQSTAVVESGAQSVIVPKKPGRRLPRVNWLFLLTVAIPTLLAIIYFGLIASDIYISESHFVVRSQQRQQSSSSLTNALMLASGSATGAALARSLEDTYNVQDFMLSRDALQTLNDQLHLDAAYGSSNVDIFRRFAGLDWWNNSFEDFYLYYQKVVDVQLVDSTSPVSVLEVRAFTADDAYRINEMLLQMSEDLINRINERARQDLIRFASKEVEEAERKAKAAALTLSSYRKKNVVVNPESQSGLHLQSISKLQENLVAIKAQLAQIRDSAPQSPQIPALNKRAETIQAEINAEMAKVAGGNLSLTDKAAEYERLSLERSFAEKQLENALSALDKARNDAQRQQLYLDRISQPNKPDKAMEPRRVRAVIATFILSMITWGVLSLLIAGVREHRD
jgi:capsular polysaccharide transport system permease protein